MKKLILLSLIISVLCLGAVSAKTCGINEIDSFFNNFYGIIFDDHANNEFPNEGIGMPNPAAVYCNELGGMFVLNYTFVIKDQAGGQRGVCILPDTTECSAWRFLEGSCGQSYSYCQLMGYNITTKTDGNNPFSPDYAVCTYPNGTEIGSVTDLMNLTGLIGGAGLYPSAIQSMEYGKIFEIPSTLPDVLDWRDYNGQDWMTKVKDQGFCGSCWSFSAVGTVEPVYNIRENNPNLDLDLSEEYVVSDCSSAGTCCGGWHYLALDYITENGTSDEDCFPYVDGSKLPPNRGCTCKMYICAPGCVYKNPFLPPYDQCSDTTCSDRCADWSSRLYYIDGRGSVLNNTEDIKTALVNKGPLSIALKVGGTLDGFDSEGIYRCSPDQRANHAVVMVGYNETGQYWIIKNSWGSTWGPDKNGYFKVGYGECDVENYVYYADYTPTTTTPPTTSTTTTVPPWRQKIDYFFSNVESAYAALKADEIDLISNRLAWSSGLFPAGMKDSGGYITAELYMDAITDSNIVVDGVAANNIYTFDINNNWDIPDYEEIRSPTTYRGFRQALAYLTDKDYIVEVICGGFCERVDQPLPASQKAWGDSSYWYPNYPYEYDPNLARATLDAEGFLAGSTPNPYYDPAFPGSSLYIKTYPPGHSKAGQDLDPLEFVVRTDDIRRLQAGRHLYQNMRKLGIPVNPIEGDMAMIFPRVYIERNYHIYTGAITTWKLPTHVYFNYHSDYWLPYTTSHNYVTGLNEIGDPNYPDLNTLLEGVYYAETLEDSIISCQAAMGLFTEYAVSIPLWSDNSYAAWSKNLLGVVNMKGYGSMNPYTYGNAYKVDGSAIRIGTLGPRSMNPIYSSLIQDYIHLDQMDSYNAYDVPPYDIWNDQAGFVKSWTVGTWDDGGVIKTKVTKEFDEDAYSVEPTTGDLKANIDASDFFFNAWYQYAFIDGFHQVKWQDLHHIDIVDSHTVDIYFDTYSYWLSYAASGPMLPMDVWMQNPLSYRTTETLTVATPDFVSLGDDPVWVESITFDGTPLTMFTDYNIVKGKLYIYTNLGSGNLFVDYWYVGDPAGYTPGDLSWITTFEGAGQYYATEFTPGLGGRLTMVKNPYYWMESRPLGEIDFVRKPNGCYKIDIYDVVLAAGAYGSQGTGVPSVKWIPGADLAPVGGLINIYDIVTITGQYGRQWDCP